MKNRTLILTSAIVAVVALAAVSFAGPGRGYGRGSHMGQGYGMMGGYGSGAGLTDEQRTALDKAHKDFAAKTETLRADLYAKDLELSAELAKSSPDQARVTALTRDVNDLRARLFAEQTAFRAELARNYGLRGGHGYGMGGGHMGQGWGMMGNGYGPGACPFWGGVDGDVRN